MKEPTMINYLLTKMSTRRCRDAECQAREFHTAHLTALGRLRFTGSAR